MMPPRITCVVLAGGLGTRLSSAVPDRPKCLAPVGKLSFLDYQLDQLFAAGVSEAVLSLGHLAEQVVDAIAHSPHRPRLRWVREPYALGTGGAIAWAMDQCGLEEAWVANGDTYLDGDVSGLRPALDLTRERVRMTLVNSAHRARFGGVEIQSGQVKAFVGKGLSGAGWINAGLYRVARQAIPLPVGPLPTSALSFESDVLPTLVREGHVSASISQARFIDIGVPEDYFRFCDEHA
jgi:D-glycero-alpha-D-manno-heptose 1-phosphate guanylyltransferase